MTPPRAVVEALYDTLPGCTECPLNRDRPTESPVCKLCWRFAEKGATAVLAAFFAGEVEGEWGATWYQPSYADREYPFVYQQDGRVRTMHWSMPSMEQARRVAHALNWRGA